MVRSRRLELPRELPHSDLNAARLPIPPRPREEPARGRGLANGHGVVKGGAPHSHAMESDLRRGDDAAVEWAVSTDRRRLRRGRRRRWSRAWRRSRSGDAPELVWLLEHPPLYTAGVSARPTELLAPDRFPVFRSGRGGRYTYHGPGQRVAYVMLDLNARTRDAHAFRDEPRSVDHRRTGQAGRRRRPPEQVGSASGWIEAAAARTRLPPSGSSSGAG